VAYRYRLETVLRVRETLEEQAKLKLAREIAVLERHRLRLRELEDERVNLLRNIEEKKRGVVPAPLFVFLADSVRMKDGQIEFQRNAIEVQNRLVEQARQALAERMKSRKIITRMREKDFMEYLKTERHRQQVEADEMAVIRFGHRAGSLMGETGEAA